MSYLHRRLVRRDDFPCAKLAARSHVGQVGQTCGRLAKSACRQHSNIEETPTPFAACRFVGQPILAAAGFQPARGDRGVSVFSRDSRSRQTQLIAHLNASVLEALENAN